MRIFNEGFGEGVMLSALSEPSCACSKRGLTPQGAQVA